MENRELEAVFGVDFSKGTGSFSDSLLSNCLSVLDTGMMEEELSYDELSMISAAGNSESREGSTSNPFLDKLF